MAIEVICAKCEEELDEPGGLIFGPPDAIDGKAAKLHLCVDCYSLVQFSIMSKAPTIPMMHEEGKDYVLGYMCQIDFECQLGAHLGGDKIYPSEEDCRENRKCVNRECGLVEVKVKATRIIHQGKY